MKRRLAFNRVLADGKTYCPGVVEIDGGVVTACYQLNGEQPMTEWLGGTVKIVTDGDGRHVVATDGTSLVF